MIVYQPRVSRAVNTWRYCYSGLMGLLGLLAVFFAPLALTFSHDVAPLLYRRCANCHHTGGVAPFALTTYADAAKRANLIAQVTAKRYMPPWLPTEPAFQH